MDRRRCLPARSQGSGDQVRPQTQVRGAAGRRAEPGQAGIRLRATDRRALDPRGREFDERNMGERLAVRNLFTDLRDQGQVGGGQAAYGERDRQAFANALDRLLTRLSRSQ